MDMETFKLEIVPMSTVDWPSKIVAVLFLNGCNMKCRYCSNHGQMGPEQGKTMNVAEVISALAKPGPSGARHIDFIDGVVFSGGEALLQPDAIREIADCLKGEGKLIGVQTNGVESGVLEGLTRLRLIDAVFLDIKAPLNVEKYRNVSPGLPEEAVGRIGKSLHMMAQRRMLGLIKYLEVRTTVFKRMNDTPEDIAAITKGLLCDAYVLQQGRVEIAPDQSLEMVTRDDLLRLARGVAKTDLLKSVVVRTHTHGDEKV